MSCATGAAEHVEGAFNHGLNGPAGYLPDAIDAFAFDGVSDGDVSYIMPGHVFLNEHGDHESIPAAAGFGSDLMSGTAQPHHARAGIQAYYDEAAVSGETEFLRGSHGGAQALAPEDGRGWATYNFEVEGLHTYVADGVRVHNDSQQIIDTAGALGQAYGSQLGMLLTDGESQFVQLAAGTVLGTVTRNLAEVISDVGLHGFAATDWDGDGVFSGGLSELGDIQADLITAGLGTASSFLTAELADALGLEGFTAELFNVTAGTVTGSILNQVVGSMVAGNSLDVAVKALNFKDAFAAIPGAVGTFLGSQLAQEILPAQSLAGSIGGSLGSIAGAALGTTFVSSALTGVASLVSGILLPGVGAFFGTIIGTFLGDLFSDDPDPRAHGYIYARGGTMTVGESYTILDDLPKEVVRAWGDAASDASQSYLDLVGGLRLDNAAGTAPGEDKDKQFSWKVPPNAQNIQHVYINVDEDEGEYRFYYYEKSGRKRADTMEEMVDRGVANFIKDAQVVGGDILLKRAVANSPSKDLTTLSGHMAVSESYAKYLDEREVINALIVAEPNSVFAGGWAVTLTQVQELKLGQTAKSDFNGGLQGFLASLELEGLAADAPEISVGRIASTMDGSTSSIVVDITLDATATVPKSLPVFADKVSQTVVNGRQVLRLEFANDLVAGGFAVVSQGTNARDVWFGSNQQGSSVNGGSGDDLLIGGAVSDNISGGNGADWIDGGAGRDSLNGGEGSDTLIGGLGDDWLRGGYGNDHFEGGAGADELDGGETAAHKAKIAAMIQRNREDGISTDEEREALEALRWENIPHTNTAGYSLSPGAVTVFLNEGRGYGFDAEGDVLIDIANLVGSAFDDHLVGGSLSNTLEGGSGADIIDGFSNSRSSNDVASYYHATAGVTASLKNPGINTGDAAGDQYIHVESLFGSAHNDTLEGDEGANFLSGGAGNDLIIAGNGTDIINGGYGFDTVSYRNSGPGVVINLSNMANNSPLLKDDYFSSIEAYEGTNYADNLTGDAGSNVLYGIGGDDVINGGAGDDYLYGGDGADTLMGGSGIDTATGGLGDDTYAVNDTGDRVIETAGGGNDKIVATVNYTLAAGQSVEILQFAISTGAANLTLIGNELVNTLYGTAGINTLGGGGGADILHGRAGNDTYAVDNAGDQVVEVAGEGDDTIVATASYVLAAGQSVETLRLASSTGSTALTLTGNELANVVIGNSGINTLGGGGGADILHGLAGNDTYAVDNAGDVVIEAAGEGEDKIVATTSYTLAAGQSVEILQFASSIGAANLTLIGNELSNTLYGTAGDNTLGGGGGADILHGRAGNDTYAVDNAGDQVFELDGEGDDTIVATATYSMAAGQSVETLRLASSTGSANLNLTGNELANTLIGNAGNNTLGGGAAADILHGRAGDDTYAVDNAGDVVIEAAGEGDDKIVATTSYTLAAGQSVEILQFASSIGAANLTLIGNELANTLYGNAGNNTLGGGGGSDILHGRGGDDTYAVDNAGDQVIETTGEGNDKIVTTTSYALAAGQSIETLQFALSTGAANLNLTGNELANTLIGSAGNNVLNGGGGADVLEGRSGNEIYTVDNAGDVVIEAVDQGDDTVVTMVSYTLAAGQSVETLQFALSTGAANLNLTGNEIANTLIGNAGNNLVHGGGGADILRGEAGDDTYAVDNAGDQVIETAEEGNDKVVTTTSYALAAGQSVETLQFSLSTGAANLNLTGNGIANTLIGNAGDNILRGDAGNDSLVGGGGIDRLIGSVGLDTMSGGAGSDFFIFYSVDESGTTTTTADRILDFSDGDEIYLAGIDANSLVSGDQAFTLATGGSFTAGQMRQRASGTDRFLEFNIDDDATAEMAILVANMAVMDAQDFVL